MTRLQAPSRPWRLALGKPLLVLALAIGALGSLAGQSTLAFYSFATTSSGNRFNVGVVDIAGDPLLPAELRGTPSSLPSATAFRWTTAAGASTECGTTHPISAGQFALERVQSMAPGHYCVVPFTIRNTSVRAMDSYLRIRLYRATQRNVALPNNDALNDALSVYMSEYSAGTHITADQMQATDCTAASFKPSSSTATATIADIAAATTTGGRKALSSLTNGGKRIGGSEPTGLALATGGGGAPTDSSMVTVLSNRTAYNIVGADQVVDPVIGGGTNAHGTQLEGRLDGGQTKYYCMAFFLPDSSLPASNTTGDNAFQSANLTYYLTVTAAQRARR